MQNVELRMRATEFERLLEERTAQRNAAQRSVEALEAANRKLRAKMADMGDEIMLLRSTLGDVQQ
eukprot:4247977-Pyramimonas_sp.AAC.2